MRIAMMLEPQEGLSYDDQLAVARRVKQTGLTGLYRSDHYASVAGHDGLDSTDAWAVLAGLARETSGITLGTLVSPVTFRAAGNLAKIVATVNEMAGAGPDGASRIELGMGTGWLEAEHRMHGFPFEDVGTRFRRLEEQLDAVTGLWDPDRHPYTCDGEHVRISEGVLAPTPSPRPRLIVGGKGLKRTPRLAARYADELNAPFATPEDCAAQRSALDRACEAVGRDPSQVGYSVMTGCCVGATEREFRARAERLQAASGDHRPLDAYIAELAGAWIIGTPEQAADRLGALADAGAQAVMLQDQLPHELEMIDVIAEDIAPRIA